MITEKQLKNLGYSVKTIIERTGTIDYRHPEKNYLVNYDHGTVTVIIRGGVNKLKTEDYERFLEFHNDN
ncbi:hypothetical protein [Salinimicrobium flavum]|uniref:HicA toxin of toxin-antitoxin n=1 Tax=Salinimicrobium flavum TaxID=1737065 RepID=A0ABW5IX25_9FLAO